MKTTQLAIIGAGPGGYAAAFLAADLGIDVTLIDEAINPGGVCLYRGCIPSKAFLHIAKVISEAKEAEHCGVAFSTPRIDIEKLRAWKQGVVAKMTGGLGQLSKQRKVQYIQGRGTFLNSEKLQIHKNDGSIEELSFRQAIIATGSRPVTLPFLPVSARVMDSTSALELKDIPKSLLVVGAGYIGMELGTVYASLGTQVSVVEMASGLLPGADRDMASVLARRVEKIFHAVYLNSKIIQARETDAGVVVSLETLEGKQEQTFEKVLVAIGRKPNSQNLGLENTKVQLTERGFIKVNSQRRTDDPAVYAIGDIAGDPMLAHKASHEGRVAVEAIAGHKVAFEPNAIPAVVFTDPELAWGGLTEGEAQQKNIPIKVAKFPWGASGRATTINREDGLTKLIIDPETERILGVGIVGPGAGELIAEGILAMEMGALASDIKMSIHPHPTLSETFMETAEVFFGQSTHVYRPKKS